MISFVFATIREAKACMKKAGVTLGSPVSFPFFYTGNVDKRKFVLCISGIGVVQAKKCITELIHSYPIDHVYNIGICGMVNDSLKVNFLYTVSKALYWSDTTKNLFHCAQNSLKDIEQVVLATCEEPVFDSVLRKEIALYADIVDMEGAAIVEECNTHSIACTLLKGVSDTADRGQVKKLFENIDSLSERMTELIWKAVFKHHKKN